MSTYALDDFAETLERVTLPSPPIECLKAWGESEEGPGCEWSGGFVLRLRNDQFAYISGWCDYTGWGCQDGAYVTLADSLDVLEFGQNHQQPKSPSSWDDSPADLQRWLNARMPAPSYIGRKPSKA